jgi:tyrosine-protein phosphatase SIW14
MKKSDDKLFLPLSFSRVDNGVYRSSYPAYRTFPFIKTLKLKSMVCLSPSDIRQDLKSFASENDITLFESEIGHNQDPFVVMSENSVADAVKFISNPLNRPVMVFCTNGKVKTGCVIGCYRQLLNWSTVSIMHEFEEFTDNEGGLADLIFIENFDKLLFSFSQKI